MGIKLEAKQKTKTSKSGSLALRCTYPPKRLVCLLAFALLLGSCGQQECPPEGLTTLLLVRHAEKASDGTDDPPLTEQGQARAELLKATLAAAGVDAIYSTPYQRNTSTVAPLAAALGLTITEYDAKQPATQFLAQLQAEHKGQQILLCGHSNTIPALLNAMTGEDQYPELAEGEYDNLFIATLSERGEAVVTSLQFRVGY